jgi:hypothetical protein
MSVTIPSKFICLSRNGGSEIAMREPIYTDAVTAGIETLTDNTTWVYSSANRRFLLQWGGFGHFSVIGLQRSPITTTVSSESAYETIFEQQATLSANTDQVALVARAKSLALEVTLWANPDKTSSIAVWTASAGSGVEATLTAGPTSIGGDEDITIEVKARRSGAATPGELFLLQVYEVELASGDLP